MQKLLITLVLSLFSSYIFATGAYQVDVVLFSHPANLTGANEPAHDSPMIPLNTHAIKLSSDTEPGGRSYHLLKPSQSSLADAYYLLNRRSQFQVLAQYSWVQPANNQSAVVLPALSNKGWEMQGTMRIRQGTYYILDTDLQFAPQANPDSAFTVVQKQRLKGGMMYYLDHPQIGMLVKINKLT